MFQIGIIYKLRLIIDENIYQGFISIFKDYNPLHLDKEFAISKGFKDKVMHGNILNGFLSYFIGECLPVKNVIIHTQDIKYYNPIYLGDEILFCAEVVNYIESVNVVQIKFTFSRTDVKKIATGNIQIGLI